VSAAQSAVEPPAAPPLFLPDPTVPGAPVLLGEAWRYETPASSAVLERIGDSARLAFIEKTTGFAIDPFVSRPDRGPGFVTFRFDLENRSDGTMVFQPQACALLSRQHDIERPLDLPTLYSVYSIQDREMPAAYANVKKALFDSQVMLHPGQRVSGLLVFRAVDPKVKSYRVEISWTTADGRGEGFEAPYRRPKK
jgi:hypothetical protein